MNSEENLSLTLNPTTWDVGKRLDAYLAENIEKWSRSRLKKLIDDGDVLVNEKEAKASYKLSENDLIEIELTEVEAESFEPEDIPLDIIYEDEFLAVINKPSGMVVHPGAGISSGTLANAIAYHFKFQISDYKPERQETGNNNSENEIANRQSQIANRIGIVHRLDKNTSGLMVVAKNQETHEALNEQFREREVYKSYVALVHGEMEENSGTIDAPIAREKHNRTKMSVRKHGRHALSLWKVKKHFEKFTLIDVEIKTGRTHQIRVHCAYINHPVVGDETYNAGRDKSVANIEIRQAIQRLDRFFLHAHKLYFTHPETKEYLKFSAPLPDELTRFLELL